MTLRVEWQQIASKDHQNGMRLECNSCGSVEYFGDSPDGDRRLHEAKASHACQSEKSPKQAGIGPDGVESPRRQNNPRG